MVFRKPYAFLIKNFKKIHIVLLILCAYLFYKTMQLNGFLNEFLIYTSYDAYLEPITKYTSLIFYFTSILVIITFLVLLILLKRKHKPWKLYLIPIFCYLLNLFVFIATNRYFNSYNGENVTATARAIHDFLFIATIPQYISFIVLLIRITGLDLNKFGFQNDQEFLELEKNDREEFEIHVNIDKDVFKRMIKKVIRYIGYFYEEHKFIMNILISLCTFFLVGYTYYYFAIEHKVVKEQQALNVNNYTITIHDSYYTDKDKKGNIIEENSGFVILNVTVINHSYQRKLDVNNFHLVNGREDITFTHSTYSNYFNDLGKNYSNGYFRNGEKRSFAMIFKVDKSLKKNNFVLYYQQYKSAKKTVLRKIKLKIKDVSSIQVHQETNLGKAITLNYVSGNKKNLSLENASFLDKIEYNTESCNEDNDCSIISKELVSDSSQKILQIEFSSSDFEGEELDSFSTDYGKIKYIANDNLAKEIPIKRAIDSDTYLGNYIYISVPKEIESSKSVNLIYTLRNQKYSYKIK